MNVMEFGPENPQIILLLHGGGLSWWNYRDVAERLAQDYHVVIPLLDGHAGSDRVFTTIEGAAAELHEYIRAQFGGSVLAIGGLSLGGQILLELLAQQPDICQYALIESASVIPMSWTGRLIGPMLRLSYGLIQKRWFAKLQFRQLHIKAGLFEDYYTATCAITRENMIAFLKSNCFYPCKESLKQCRAKGIVVVGEKESSGMKRSARLLQQMLPNSQCVCLPGYTHGALSLNHADEYEQLIRQLIGQ